MATVLCDLDGTLLVKIRRDPPGFIAPKRAALNRALADVCGVPNIDFLQGMEHGLTDWLIAERAVRSHRPGYELDGRTWRNVCARAEAVYAPPPPDAESLYQCLPGVPGTLRALRRAGHRLGIVTGNIAFFALFKLNQAGIDRALFNGPVAFGDHGRERAQILRTALARCGSDPALVLGDTVHDRDGAEAVGLPFLGTGAMGLQSEEVAASETSPAAWVPGLADARVVLDAVDALLGSEPRAETRP